MVTAQALQHLASNVEKGYFPQKGAGFQTVAVSEALVGTDDLRRLEDMAAYYEVTADRRAQGDLPLKESCFRLPSGAVAVGKTIDWGSSHTGRSGNYLAYHWVLPEDQYLALGADPFTLLDQEWPAMESLDLAPRALEPRVLGAVSRPAPSQAFERLPEKWLEAWVGAALGLAEKPGLVIGPEAESRALLGALLFALPSQDRLGVTFSTHFYRACDHHRQQFRIATVRSGSEGPSQRNPYVTFDLEAATVRPEPTASAGAYVRWLARTLKSGNVAEAEAVRQAICGETGNDGVSPPRAVPLAPLALAALAERAPHQVGSFLGGDPEVVIDLLKSAAEPRRLADALLAKATPGSLAGNGSVDAAARCMAAVRAAASGGAWKEWERKYAEDPRVKSNTRPAWAFWRR